MYLSRLVPNPRSSAVRRDLADPYDMHRTLLRAFTDMERILWRVDRLANRPVVLVQTGVEPNWDALREQYPDYLLRAAEMKTYEPSVSTGQVLRFRLRANPTVKKEGGKRVGVGGEEGQADWLCRRKAERGGFQVDQGSLLITYEGLVMAHRDEANPMAFASVRFDGVLTVTDAGLMISAIERGIGSAKAFGFGLLSVARIHVP